MPIGETASAVAQVVVVGREAPGSLPERKKGKGRSWRDDHHDHHDDRGVKRQPAAHGVREDAKRREEEKDPQRPRPV
jgi:hypothetical protein